MFIMKKILSILSIFVCTTTLFSQNSDTKKADIFFKKSNFSKAAEEYLKIAETPKANTYVYTQLADSYYYTSNNAQAEKWYAKALESSNSSETIFRYAQTLKSNGKMENYKLQMQKLAAQYPNDIRVKEYLKNPDFALSSSKEKFTVKELDINSENSDFGSFYNDGILYFASARNQSNKKYDWTNEPSLDIYKSVKSSDMGFTTPVEVAEVNSAYNDGPATITADGKTMYFSSETWRYNSFEKNKNDKLKLSKNCIYKAENVDGKWKNLVSLPINSTDYSTSNPCISRDGKTLYFSSNRPGGFGGVDIWKVDVNSDGTVSAPINLGNKVNTEANESFPFISDDNNTLYFSSNGKNGYGAYDIYEIKLNENSEAKNLGKSVNTSFDDFAFSYYENAKIGFLSSNRAGNDNIYSVESICERTITTIVRNEKTNQIIPNATISVLDSNKAVVSNNVTNDKGELSFSIECNKDYTLLVTKENFENKSVTVPQNNNLPNTKMDVLLKPNDVIITDKEVILQPIYFELNKWNITSQGATELDKLVRVMKEYPNMVIFAKSHTDSRGTDMSNLTLSDKRAKSTVAYIISKGIDASRISGKGFGESELKVNCTKCSEEEHSQNRRSEFLIVKK